jgi:hypothetical protein
MPMAASWGLTMTEVLLGSRGALGFCIFHLLTTHHSDLSSEAERCDRSLMIVPVGKHCIGKQSLAFYAT